MNQSEKYSLTAVLQCILAIDFLPILDDIDLRAQKLIAFKKLRRVGCFEVCAAAAMQLFWIILILFVSPSREDRILDCVYKSV